MEDQSMRIDESREFRCPSCGTSAFEVIGTHVDLSSGNRREKSLVLQCFDCLELFHHRLESEESHGDEMQIPLADSVPDARVRVGHASTG